jgi:hypothetical protein
MSRPRIKSYEEAARFLGRHTERPTGQRGTWVVRLTPTEIAVRYHNTDVVIYHHPVTGKLATIGNGGWFTPTTASRITEYAPEGVVAELEALSDGSADLWVGDGLTGAGEWLGLHKTLVIHRDTGE